ncbi:MAG: pilus assembly protein TadG-related protein, partial [Alphaproteobacteria bacterium]
MAVYVAAVGTLLIGMGVIGLDVGRMAVLRSQMQNAADAAAMSAAGQLDGLDKARARATDVATDGLVNATGLANGVGEFVIQDTEFFREIVSTAVPSTSDADANFVRVTLEPRDIDLHFRPVLNLLTGGYASSTATLAATATAGGAPVMCHIPPLMMCNMDEDLGPGYDLLDPSHRGKQVVMKEGPGGGAFAPGNYGTLCTPAGDCGASAVGDALANPDPQMCYTDVLTTAPGVKTQETRRGMNARMDTGKYNPKNPAR